MLGTMPGTQRQTLLPISQGIYNLVEETGIDLSIKCIITAHEQDVGVCNSDWPCPWVGLVV